MARIRLCSHLSQGNKGLRIRRYNGISSGGQVNSTPAQVGLLLGLVPIVWLATPPYSHGTNPIVGVVIEPQNIETFLYFSSSV